jgi:formate C-acetyltransferase
MFGEVGRMVTPRVERLYGGLLGAKPSISIERARLYTEAIRDTGGMSVIMQRATGLCRVLEKKEVKINSDELIVGSLTEKERGAIVTPEFGWQWILEELDVFSRRESDRMEIWDDEKDELRRICTFWEQKSVEERVSFLLSERMKKALATGFVTMGGHTTSLGNITPDYPLLLNGGLVGIKKRVLNRLREVRIRGPQDLEKIEFYHAARITIEAAIGLAERYSKHAAMLAEEAPSSQRRAELERIARICKHVPRLPARDFTEAVQSLWFVHLIFHIESSPHAMLLGRIDQYLYPYYKRDLEEGRLTRDDAKELLECLWIKITELIKIRDAFYSEAFSGFPLFQVVMVGGVDENGDDVTNDLSYAILEVIDDVRTTQPSVSFRYHHKSPDAFLRKACTVVKAGLGIPAFVNDGVIIPKMLRRGATIREARNYVTNCIEPEIPGMTDSRAHSGYVNFGKCIELVFHNGVDPMSGKKIGPETGKLGSLQSFEDFYQAVLAQIGFAIDLIEASYNICELVHRQLVPEVFLSLFIRDCIERGETRQAGGARYNHSTIFGTGPATLVDSLAAVKKVVYEDRTVDLETLRNVLSNDFIGEERFRQMLLNKCPKYGNDQDGVDAIARAIVTFFCEAVQSRGCLRGGTYLAELHSVTMHAIFGKMCGATPDGRKKGYPLSDGVSPVQGSDRAGPTAVIKSVAKLDHLNVLNGTLLNQKFSPHALKTEADYDKFASLIKTYFALGGHHIQFNMVDGETLRKAQSNPDRFRNLIVRVAGYSAFFTELTKAVQDEIIQRTEHQVL